MEKVTFPGTVPHPTPLACVFFAGKFFGGHIQTLDIRFIDIHKILDNHLN